ncbi:hypothetical protein C8R46DRAFT_1246966 [Mycena filopes]|nr:hypothetical protein C8R46DRAFT_1246966 [Mycena filopes]
MKFSVTFIALSLVALGAQASTLPARPAIQRRVADPEPAAAPAPASPFSAPVARAAKPQSAKKTVFESCKSDSECQQGCCGFSTGLCAGPAVAQTNGSGGCGRGNKQPNCNVAAALKLSDCTKGAVKGNVAGKEVQAAAKFVSQLDNLPFTPTAPAAGKPKPKAAAGKPKPKPKSANKPKAKPKPQSAKKTVFESCKADSECQQGCCGFSTGLCAGPAVAQTNGSGGCGHGNKQPNCNVAAALKLSDCTKGATKGNVSGKEVQAAAKFVSKLDNLPFTPA